MPLAAEITPGQAHESKRLESSVERVRLPRPGGGRPRTRPKALAADKGYSYPRIRRYLRRRGVKAVIPDPQGPASQPPIR